MAVALADLASRRRPRPRASPARARTGSAPRRIVPPLLEHAALVGHQVDDRVRRVAIELDASSRRRGRRRCARTRRPRAACRGRCRRTGSCSRARSGSPAILPSVPRSPKPPGTRIASTLAERAPRRPRCSISSESMYSRSTRTSLREAAVDERLVQRLVRVAQVHVLADDADLHGAARGLLEALDDALPRRRGPAARDQMLRRSAIWSSRPSAWRRERQLVDAARRRSPR